MANASFDDPRMEPERSQGARSSGRPVVSGPEPVQAQFSSGTFSTVTAVSNGNINAPQMRIVQTNSQDFARLRFSVQSQDFWDIATVFDRMNFFDQTHGDVMTLRSNGDLSITGTFTQGSSRTLKDHITELSSTEALETLAHLSPVKFRYKADIEQTTHVGFIAEEVPEMVAHAQSARPQCDGYRRGAHQSRAGTAEDHWGLTGESHRHSRPDIGCASVWQEAQHAPRVVFQTWI